jgi:hypothetical protein
MDELAVSNVLTSEMVRRWTRHAAGLVAVNAGGALTGYLASRSRQGALIGAAAHTAMFSTAQTIFGAQLTKAERVAFAVLALGSVGMTSWLFMQRRK